MPFKRHEQSERLKRMNFTFEIEDTNRKYIVPEEVARHWKSIEALLDMGIDSTIPIPASISLTFEIVLKITEHYHQEQDLPDDIINTFIKFPDHKAIGLIPKWYVDYIDRLTPQLLVSLIQTCNHLEFMPLYYLLLKYLSDRIEAIDDYESLSDQTRTIRKMFNVNSDVDREKQKQVIQDTEWMV